MGEIPEDVELAATLALDAILASDSQYANVGIIARAILAERKRCAEVARETKPSRPLDDFDGGMEVACDRIIEAIESGQ